MTESQRVTASGVEAVEKMETNLGNERTEEKIQFLQQVDLNLITYIPPILLAIGLLGNTLTVVVLSRFVFSLHIKRRMNYL